MARVTVEDCIEVVTNRFDLVLLSTRRARSIAAGAQLTIDRDNDKNPVIALREIAEKSISTEDLEDAIIKSMQRNVAIQDDSDADLDSEFQAELRAGDDAGVDQVSADQMAQEEAEAQLNVIDEDLPEAAEATPEPNSSDEEG